MFQFSSVTQSCPTLCNPMDYSMPGLPVYHQLPEFTKLMSIESVMPSNHLILCRPLLLLPSIFHRIRVFSNESALHPQVAKVLEFQLQHQSFQWILCFVHYYFPCVLIYFDQLYDMSKVLNLCELRLLINKVDILVILASECCPERSV